jgi:hypothetical protein
MADDHTQLAIEAPMNKQTKPLVTKPFKPLLFVQWAEFRIVFLSMRTPRGEGDGKE